MRFSPVTLIVIACLSLAAARIASAAPDTSSLINEALDQPVKLELDTVLPKAMQIIGDKTGVTVVADPAVWDLLPWGEQTNIKATIQNQTLRAALDAMARRLGLVSVLKAQAVELQPMPAMRRLGRRATDSELELLDLLAGTKLGMAPESSTVEKVVDAVDQKLQQVKPEFAVEFRGRDVIDVKRAVPVARNATAYEALEALARETNATWYPWGKSVVVLPREAQIRNNQLGRTVSVRYNSVDVTQVLVELSEASGVKFEIEPGAIQRIPPEFRNIRISLGNGATVESALEAISGFTGLEWAVKGEGVYIWNQSSGTGAAGGQQDPVVGMIQMDNGMQVMIRRSSLPPDVREYLDQRVAKQIDKIREMMKDEGFKPSTRPATQPATEHAPPSPSGRGQG
jgi:hypothetical protein